MRTQGNPASGAAASAADQAEASTSLIKPTGDASLDVLAGDINDAHAAFQPLSDPEASTLDKANAAVGGTLNAMMLPITLLNDGFALATRDIGKLIELPAATLGMLHLGIPHVHLHPPAMPIPLPSFGPVALAGCASVLINGIPAARAGDMGISLLCGTFAPPFEVFTGSSKVFFGGARAARMLDITMHCMPGAGAARAMATLMKVASVGMGVVGVGAEALDAVTKAERAKRLRAKKVEPKAIDPSEAAKMTPEELAAAQEAAAAAAAEQQQENLEEAAADEASAKITGIQAGLDAAALALSLLMGMDPGTPPCIGAVLTGHPNVLIGGFPMPPWSAVARGLGKLGKSKGRKRKSKHPIDKGKRRGHPIDPITGANEDEFLDYEQPAPVGFRWERNYTSAGADREGQMGRGFRHGYEHRLKVDLDQVAYTDARGQTVEIPLPRFAGEETSRGGYVLRVWVDGAAVTYELERRDELAMWFVRERRADAGCELRLARMHTAEVRMRFLYDDRGQLRGIDETSDAAAIETRLALDDRGHIVEVRRGPRGERELPLIAAYAYDHAGRLVLFQDAVGARGRYAYDSSHRLVRMTDRNGYSFHFAYDAQGRCVEEHGDDGLWRVALRYEPENRQTVITQADGGEWIYGYDENQTLACIRDPYGGQRRLVTDDEGRVTSEIGADGRTLWEFFYNRDGERYGLVDRYGGLHPPLDVEPNPPLPPAHQIANSALTQQWGAPGDTHTGLDDWRYTLPGQVQAFLATLPSDAPTTEELSREWDPLGRLITETDASGRRQSWAYDANGNPVRFVDRDGREHRVEISSWNLIGAIIDPLGNRTCVDYTAHERVARIVDPGGSESRYDYDLKDRLVRVVRHGVVREEYSYDAGDRLVEKRDAAGEVLVRCVIGDDSLPSEYTLTSGEVFRYGYDERGEVTRASTRDVEVHRRFDAGRRLVFDERDGRGVRHGYSGDTLEHTTYLGRFTVFYRTEPDGSSWIESPVGGEHRIRGDRGGVLLELGSGSSVLSSYDEEGRCTGRAMWRKRGVALALWSVRYSYSAEGDLLRVDDSDAGVTHYSYDAAHRLVGEVGPDGVASAIVLDVAGNVREKPGLPRAEVLEGNRLSTAGRERFGYDERNHLAEWTDEAGEVTRYQYNSLGMLVRVSWSGREESFTAGYDGIGRRLWKALGGHRTEYFWDGDRLAAEIGPTGVVRIYIYAGPEALVPLMFIDYTSVDADPASGHAYYPICNQAGLPLHIEDEAGTIVWRARHVEPYGAVVLYPGASITYAPRFPGHHFDEETGLHYNRFRYYSPRLGRYLQSDPAGQEGGVNLYAYPANPLVDVDVLGLLHSEKQWQEFVQKHPIKENTPTFKKYAKYYRKSIGRFIGKENFRKKFIIKVELGTLESEFIKRAQADAAAGVKAQHDQLERGRRHGDKPLLRYSYTEPISMGRDDSVSHHDKAFTYFYKKDIVVEARTFPLGKGEHRSPLILEFDNRIFAFIHAIANSGASKQQLFELRTDMKSTFGEKLQFVGGDLNHKPVDPSLLAGSAGPSRRSPRNVGKTSDFTPLSTGKPTHHGTHGESELDWAYVAKGDAAWPAPTRIDDASGLPVWKGAPEAFRRDNLRGLQSASDHAAILYTTPDGRKLLVWNAQDWKGSAVLSEANKRRGVVLQELLLSHRPDVVVLLETGEAGKPNKFIQDFIDEITDRSG
ncbi:RHS repeat-associated core domain-containing protein [Sorangium sp. So ce321]|uniref:RHS repeat-associated core domain-containing protein n=1 Tax=Sorangium sp. So ce321 TaxID=3133300 RepID=UPI003F6384C1